MTRFRVRDPKRGPVAAATRGGPAQGPPQVAKKLCWRTLAAQHLGGLKSLGPLGDLELDFLALLQ